jgi:hypothetical protein
MTYKRDDDVIPLLFCNYLGPKPNVVIPFHLPEDLTANDRIHLNIPFRNNATSGNITATGHIQKANDSDADFDITGTGNATAFSTAWESDANVTVTGSSGSYMKQIARFVFSPDNADYLTHAAAGKLFVFTITVDSGALTALNSHAYIQRCR